MIRGTRVSGGFRRSRGGRLFPRRRAVDRAAMRSDRNHFRQLALRREIAWNVLVVSGHCTKFFAGSLVGIEHYDGLARAFLEIVERRNEVGVSRYEHDAVEVGLNVVNGVGEGQTRMPLT